MMSEQVIIKATVAAIVITALSLSASLLLGDGNFWLTW